MPNSNFELSMLVIIGCNTEQMSKLTAQISHQKKIKQNQTNLDEQQTKNLQVQYENLKIKMAEIQQKRTKKLQQKYKSFKANDQKWYNKLKQIQSKFIQKNRQAYKKAQKYRQQSQNYWKDKQKKLQQLSRIKLKNSKTKHTNHSPFNKSFAQGMLQKNHHKLFPLTLHKRNTLNHRCYFSSSRSIHTQKIQLDDLIKSHKQKSISLQKQKQMLIFQKAMQKMQKIQKKRQKVTKQKQPKLSSPTKAKIIDNIHEPKTQPRKKQFIGSASFYSKNHSKQQLDKAVKDHLQIRQRLRQQQFHQRGQVYQNSVQKTRKDRILRMIKNKVHQIKVNVLMSQRSKSNLVS